MEKITIPHFKLVGIKLKGKTTNENKQAAKDCGDLWQKFEKGKIADSILDKLSDDIYAVYFDYEKDETKPYSYFIGCKVDENADTPKNLQNLEIPTQEYKVVTAKGEMTDCIIDAWGTIWNSEIDRKFGYDFEIYDERSRDWKDAELDIYVSLKD